MSDPAVFSPAIGFKLRVKATTPDDAPEIHVTTDIVSDKADERRHFVDRHYLATSVPGGEKLLETLKDPSPFCSHLVMGNKNKEDGEVVVGMLAEPLPMLLNLETVTHDRRVVVGFDGMKKQWTPIKLTDVLVIDKLPVPLHVSFRTLSMQGQIKVCSIPQPGEHVKENFPEHYGYLIHTGPVL